MRHTHRERARMKKSQPFAKSSEQQKAGAATTTNN